MIRRKISLCISFVDAMSVNTSLKVSIKTNQNIDYVIKEKSYLIFLDCFNQELEFEAVSNGYHKEKLNIKTKENYEEMIYFLKRKNIKKEDMILEENSLSLVKNSDLVVSKPYQKGDEKLELIANHEILNCSIYDINSGKEIKFNGTKVKRNSSVSILSLKEKLEFDIKQFTKLYYVIERR